MQIVPTTVLTFVGRKWRCKSIIATSQSLFYCNNTYYNVGRDENTVFENSSVSNAIFIAFEIIEESEVILDDNLAYIGNENQKIKSTFDPESSEM